MKIVGILFPVLALTTLACQKDNRSETTWNTVDAERANSPATVTEQGENQTDLKIVQNIRKALLKEEILSTSAKNIKIISTNGVITLRGMIENRAEQDLILKIVNAEKGISKINNQLEIKISNL